MEAIAAVVTKDIISRQTEEIALVTKLKLDRLGSITNVFTGSVSPGKDAQWLAGSFPATRGSSIPRLTGPASMFGSYLMHTGNTRLFIANS